MSSPVYDPMRDRPQRAQNETCEEFYSNALNETKYGYKSVRPTLWRMAEITHGPPKQVRSDRSSEYVLGTGTKFRTKMGEYQTQTRIEAPAYFRPEAKWDDVPDERRWRIRRLTYQGIARSEDNTGRSLGRSRP